MSCPTPSKQRHDTKAAAWRHANGLRHAKDASVDLKPYRCPSGGHWHVGHSQASLTRRIRLARRKGTA